MSAEKFYTREIYQTPTVRLPDNFIQQLPESFPQHGRIIHNARNQIRVYELEDQEINVKKFCIPPIFNRILYSLGWRTPKAKTTFLNAQEKNKVLCFSRTLFYRTYKNAPATSGRL